MKKQDPFLTFGEKAPFKKSQIHDEKITNVEVSHFAQFESLVSE
jgi:hypothetical protein